jgi:hypothetical protein
MIRARSPPSAALSAIQVSAASPGGGSTSCAKYRPSYGASWAGVSARRTAGGLLRPATKRSAQSSINSSPISAGPLVQLVSTVSANRRHKEEAGVLVRPVPAMLEDRYALGRAVLPPGHTHAVDLDPERAPGCHCPQRGGDSTGVAFAARSSPRWRRA